MVSVRSSKWEISANCTGAFKLKLKRKEKNLFLKAIASTKKIAMSFMVLKPQLMLDCSLSKGDKMLKERAMPRPFCRGIFCLKLSSLLLPSGRGSTFSNETQWLYSLCSVYQDLEFISSPAKPGLWIEYMCRRRTTFGRLCMQKNNSFQLFTSQLHWPLHFHIPYMAQTKVIRFCTACTLRITPQMMKRPCNNGFGEKDRLISCSLQPGVIVLSALPSLRGLWRMGSGWSDLSGKASLTVNYHSYHECIWMTGAVRQDDMLTALVEQSCQRVCVCVRVCVYNSLQGPAELISGRQSPIPPKATPPLLTLLYCARGTESWSRANADGYNLMTDWACIYNARRRLRAFLPFSRNPSGWIPPLSFLSLSLSPAPLSYTSSFGLYLATHVRKSFGEERQIDRKAEEDWRHSGWASVSLWLGRADESDSLASQWEPTGLDSLQ